MAALTKRQKTVQGKVDRNRNYPVAEALKLAKEFATAKFNESIDVAVCLGIDARNQLISLDRLAVLLDDFNQHATGWRRQFENHFIGFDVDQVFVARYRLADLLVPANQCRLRNGFRQLRDFDLMIGLVTAMVRPVCLVLVSVTVRLVSRASTMSMRLAVTSMSPLGVMMSLPT